MYTVDYFIEKFSKIPESKWCLGDWCKDDRKCAGGHCGYPQSSKEFFALQKMFESITRTFTDVVVMYGNHKVVVADVNDGQIQEYQQKTPKARILAALYDIRAAQQKAEVKEEETFKSVPIKSEFIPVTFKKVANELITSSS